MISVKKKIMLICALSIVSLFSVVALSATRLGHATFDFSNVADNYYVVDGAYILCDDDAVGIRFTVVCTEDYYSAASAETSTWHIDIYSALSDVCVEQIIYADARWKAVDDIIAQDGQSTGESGYTYSVYITYNNLQNGDYKTALCYELYIKAYVVIGETDYYADSNNTVRSMREVAANAQEDPFLSDDEKDSLGKYYLNVSHDNEMIYYEKGDDEESLFIAAAVGDGTGYKAYIGNTEVTSDVSFTSGALSFNKASTSFSKLKPAKKYYLTVANDTNVYSKVIMPVTRLLTQDNFVSVLSASTTDDYFVLTEDVDLDATAYANAITVTYCKYALDFNGTFDGMGHTITVEYNDTSSGLAGLFRNINGTMKNFEYAMDVTYAHSGAPEKGFFAYDTNQSVIENAYIHVKSRKAAGNNVVDNAVGLVARPLNGPNAATIGSGVFRRCILEYKHCGDRASSTYADGKIYIANGARYVKFDDCMFINGGDTGAQFTASTNANAAYSARVTDSYKYATMEDWIDGINGYTCTGNFMPLNGGHSYTETAIAGTSVQYNDWNAGGIWNISDGTIKLYGNTVYTYTERAISASIDKETLTITDNESVSSLKAYDVYVGETKIGSFTGTSCNVGLMLETNEFIAEGANNITVTVITSAGRTANATATFTATGLTQDNFMSALNASTAGDYFILTEDVAFDKNVYDTATYTTGNNNAWGHFYAVNLNGTFDGMGHRIAVDITSATTTNCAGLFNNINGTMRNFEYVMESDYSIHYNQANKGFFAFNTNQSVIENAYIHVKMRGFAWGTTTPTTDAGTVALIATPQNGSAGAMGTGVFRRCIFDVKRYDVENEAYVDGKLYCGNVMYYVTFDDCVFINGGSSGDQFAASTNANAAYSARVTDSYKYATMEDWIDGINGYTCTGNFMPLNGGHSYTETAIAGTSVQYNDWNAGGIWNISDGTIKLYGNTVYTAV